MAIPPARILATAAPPAMITDAGIPSTSDARLCRLARDTPTGRKMAIVMVSGDGHPDVVTAALNPGADRYLTKPVSSRGIVAALRQVSAGGNG